MIIYGVALLAFCFLAGKLVGAFLGYAIGIDGDVGGVGFAMLFLMLLSLYFRRKGWFDQLTERGITFWSHMYLPIIVAMAATQNVRAAISSGPVAIVAGVVATTAAMLLVPVISKIGRTPNPQA